VGHKLKILFFISWLGGGGAEMHLLRLVNHLDRDNFELSLALVRRGGAYEEALAADIRPHYLGSSRFKSSTWQMCSAILPLRRLIAQLKPNVLCSVMDHSNIAAILATRHLSHRPKLTLCVQHFPTYLFESDSSAPQRIIGFLARQLYPVADSIVALSNGVAMDIQDFISQTQLPLYVIYNAGVDDRVFNLMQESLSKEEIFGSGPKIMACGRLCKQKGFQYLLEAMVYIRRIVPATLWIVGEGSERGFLQEKIRQLDLENCVYLLGFKTNPFKYMAAADVFVLSSLTEGFGNVLVEAMACGVPVVSTDCPYGPSEIIQDGVNGLLVSPADSRALATAIVRVLQDRQLAQTLIRNGKNRSMDFAAQAIAGEYGELFLRLAK